MIKTLVVIIGGVFVGAVGAEIIRKKYPRFLDKFYTRTGELFSEGKAAFKSGYDKSAGTDKGAPA